ncbi:thiamine pyrophosphate-dependent enzyme [Streptomyces sp. Ag109_O5-10]|uniref:thiamine pyrophosphate-dependent enzyme n=1 Tax=Streptomyces sp. Ag109_O5-10 TaxID=1855349 RepID=UPI00089B2238|nr:thiamine pyrophosphate-dependent enzyme [Streptomyces sp. Ag109_O5-10]SEE97309.1 pyruvate dehydrogenase (quinone) [Streptomyces sp. Ag109_O5-10]
MSRTVADGLWEMLVSAGVRRCYGIVGDALNPVVDALRRNGQVDFVHVRNEEFGVFAAVAEARLTGQPVVVCGTAGPGVVHLVNGMLDARKERVPVIVLAGDTETGLLDSETVEELNPYRFFATSAVYVARLVNPAQLRHVVTSAVTAAVTRGGPAVLSLPGDVAAASAPKDRYEIRLPRPARAPAGAEDLAAMAGLINEAGTVAVFGGQGCAGAHAEVTALAGKLGAPVGYSLKGKQFLEHDNANAVGMTGLLGYGGCHHALHHADVLLMLGTDFPFAEFLPQHGRTRIIQVDHEPERLGRRVPVDLAVAGDVRATVQAILPLVEPKPDGGFLARCVEETERFHRRMRHYTEKGPRIRPIRPEYVATVLSDLADEDALFFADTGTPVIWAARHIRYGPRRRLSGSFSWASMATASPGAFGAQLAFPGRQTIALCGDGGFSMLALGDLLTEVQRRLPVVHVVLNNSGLEFVRIEQQEAGLVPFGTDFATPDFAAVAEAMGARGIRIEDPGEVADGLATALAHTGGPVVVDVLVDPYALAIPARVPASTAAGFTLSAARQVFAGRLDDVVDTATHNVRLA